MISGVPKLPAQPLVAGFHHEATGSVQYVVADPATRRCAIIDPVLDFDPCSAATATRSAQALLDHVEREGLNVEWILDTHPHADHFSAAAFIHDTLFVPDSGTARTRGGRLPDPEENGRRYLNIPLDLFDGPRWEAG